MLCEPHNQPFLNVWALNYAANGATPDATDIALYGVGFFGWVGVASAAIVAPLKGMVDDDINNKLREIRQVEDPRCAPFIKACYRFAATSPGISATTVASMGGTAWMHPNGLWVYLTDAQGAFVADYKPKMSVKTYQPKLPLRQGTVKGRFIWGSV